MNLSLASNGFPPNRFDVVVHLGAGYCRELDEHLASGAERVVLVEANPAIAADLVRRCAGEPRITLVEAAIAEKAGARVLRIYNYAGASSIRAAKNLETLFPGLRLIREAQVSALAADAFIKGLSLAEDKNNALIVDAPGEEAAILSILASADLLSVFAYVRVHCSSKPLYEGAKDVRAISDLVAKSGYAVRKSAEDPDRPVLHAQINFLHKAKALEAELAKARENAARLEEQLINKAKALEAELAKAREDLARFEEQLHERDHRQSLIDQEVLRVEAQIEVVKDILIREKVV